MRIPAVSVAARGREASGSIAAGYAVRRRSLPMECFVCYLDLAMNGRTKWSDDQFGKIDRRFDRLEAHMDARFSELSASLDSLTRSIIGGAVGLAIALILKGLLGG